MSVLARGTFPAGKRVMHTCIQLYNVRTTVAMESATRDRLLALKAAWGARSIEEVIERLVGGAPMGARALYAQRKREVDAVLRKHRVRRLVAFGSRARGDARPDSDLDLVATLPAGASLLDVVRLKDDLEAAFGLPVNIVSPRAMGPRLRKHVDRDGVVLVG